MKYKIIHELNDKLKSLGVMFKILSQRSLPYIPHKAAIRKTN